MVMSTKTTGKDTDLYNSGLSGFYDRTALQRDKLEYPIKVIGNIGREGGLKELAEEVRKRLKDGMKILDVGCGTGHVLLEVYGVTDKKVEMTGIDYSKGMIEVAKSNSEGISDVSFYQMDAYKTGFGENYFDMVNDRLGPESYGEIHRILKKGGMFYLFLTDNGDWEEAMEHFGFKEHFDLNERVKLLEDTGFKIIKVKKYSSVEYYRDLEHLANMLEIIPFTPPFDRKKHYKLLAEYGERYKTGWGIKTSHKRVLIIGTKP